MDDIYAKSFNADKAVVEEWGTTIVEKDGSYSAGTSAPVMMVVVMNLFIAILYEASPNP